MNDFTPEPRATAPWGQTQGPILSANVQATMTQMTTQRQTVIDAAERPPRRSARRRGAGPPPPRRGAAQGRSVDRERVGLISDLDRRPDPPREHRPRSLRADDQGARGRDQLGDDQARAAGSDRFARLRPAAAIPGQTAFGDPAAVAPQATAPVYTAPAPAAQPSPTPTPTGSAVSEEALLHATHRRRRQRPRDDQRRAARRLRRRRPGAAGGPGARRGLERPGTVGRPGTARADGGCPRFRAPFDRGAAAGCRRSPSRRSGCRAATRRRR